MLRSSFPEERKGEREREGGKEEKKEGRERGRRKERKKEKEKGNDRKSRLCTRSVWRSLPRYFRGDESQMSKSNSTRHRGNERFSYRTDQIERIFGRVFSIRVRICPCIGEGGGCGPRFSLKTTWNYFTNRERENEERISMRG